MSGKSARVTTCALGSPPTGVAPGEAAGVPTADAGEVAPGSSAGMKPPSSAVVSRLVARSCTQVDAITASQGGTEPDTVDDGDLASLGVDDFRVDDAVGF